VLSSSSITPSAFRGSASPVRPARIFSRASATGMLWKLAASAASLAIRTESPAASPFVLPIPVAIRPNIDAASRNSCLGMPNESAICCAASITFPAESPKTTPVLERVSFRFDAASTA
jgi:hypothetical protein